jgi:dolichyl-phosphate beta-glucosyltransferase
MPQTLDISLVLPAYNERATIAFTIQQAFDYFQRRGLQAEIIVAADGNDGTRELVRELGASYRELKVIGREERSGKGRGIREAVMLARGRIVGYADADNKVPISEFDKIRPWLAEGYQVVTGSRGLAESQIERSQPWYRRLGSHGFYYFMQWTVGLPGIRDTQCGFKYFPHAAARRLFELQRIDGYMFDVEILALAHRIGYRIVEVPICWRDDADSRLELFTGNIRNVIDIFRIRSYCRESIPEIAVAAAAVNKE